MHFKRAIRKFHRSLSVIIGIQILFWTVSGTYFSLIPLETVRGEDRSQPATAPLINTDTPTIAPSAAITQSGLQNVREVRLAQTEDGLVYALHTGERYPAALIHAETGEPVPTLTDAQAIRAAHNDYGDSFVLGEAQNLDNAPAEYKGPLPVWRVTVNDSRGTRLYISPIDGNVLARRNNYWRIFDFLWMLHILDFNEREDFNNNLLRTVAIGSVVLVISGYALWTTSRRWKKR